MSDFQTVRNALVAGVLNSHPNTSASIADAMVRQLAALEPETVPFMEQAGSFATVAGDATYALPAGLFRFDYLYYDLGSSILDIEIVDDYTVRFFQERPNMAYPTRAAWLVGELQLGPAPAGIYTVKWGGYLSSKKDAATGAAITTSSTTQANPWLTEGVVTFKHLVLADYYANDPASARADLAQSHGAFATSQLAQLRKAQQQKKDQGRVAQVPNAFDNFVSRPDRRVQRFFPGAHG